MPKKACQTARDPLSVLLSDLEAGGALTALQATILRDSTGRTTDWSSPFLRNVREHTRAYVDQLRSQQHAPVNQHEQRTTLGATRVDVEIDCPHWTELVEGEPETCWCLSCGNELPCARCATGPSDTTERKVISHA
jgi:hypothetical protein